MRNFLMLFTLVMTINIGHINKPVILNHNQSIRDVELEKGNAYRPTDVWVVGDGDILI